MRTTRLGNTAVPVHTKAKGALIAAALFVATAAQADFSGFFDPSNWTQSPGTGSVNSFSSGSLSMTSGNDLSGTGSNTDVTIPLANAGTISFYWNWVTSDDDIYDPAFYDPFFVLNPSPDQLTVFGPGSATTQSGSHSFSANALDVIGFRIRTEDNVGGSATVRISNFCFQGPNDPECSDGGGNVPEPGSLALLGLGLASLAAARRRKQ